MSIISEIQEKLESLIKQMEENKNEIESIENKIKDNLKEIICLFQKIDLDQSYNQNKLVKDSFNTQSELFNNIKIISSNYSKMFEIYEEILNLGD